MNLEKIKTHGKKRSDEWPKIRKAHLKMFPKCMVCGTKKDLQVHHIRPFHLHPELELKETNLITLCEGMERNCHRLFGHLDDFHSINVNVRRDSATWNGKIKNRP